MSFLGFCCYLFFFCSVTLDRNHFSKPQTLSLHWKFVLDFFSLFAEKTGQTFGHELFPLQLALFAETERKNKVYWVFEYFDRWSRSRNGNSFNLLSTILRKMKIFPENFFFPAPNKFFIELKSQLCSLSRDIYFSQYDAKERDDEPKFQTKASTDEFLQFIFGLVDIYAYHF